MKGETAVIIANGERKEIKLPCSVQDFLTSYGFRAKQVVVEHNGQVLERSKADEVHLREGDHVEIIVPVAGG